MGSVFEGKVNELVEQLGKDIAQLSHDEVEYEDGITLAVMMLLDSIEDEPLPDFPLADEDDWDDDEDEYTYNLFDVDDDEDEFRSDTNTVVQ